MQQNDALATRAACEARRNALLAAHMVPLEALRAALEMRFGPVPHPDPADGGTGARVLLLLETPGPGKGDGPRFVSRDNPTGTARNIRRLSARAGLARADTVIWNAVPWVIHAPGARNRAPRRAEVAAGLAALPAFLDLLPTLRVVVLAGRIAGTAGDVVQACRPAAAVLRMPHPSPTFVNTAPHIAGRIVDVLGEAARLIA